MTNKVLDQQVVLKKYINEEDYAQIKELEQCSLKYDKVNLKLELEYKLQVQKDYDKSFNDINEYFYYINNELVGYLGIASFGRSIGEINGVVHSDWRRRGIFTKLCNLAIEECKKRSFDKILLLCDEKSTPAVEFIKAVGANYAFSECRMRLNGKAVNESNQNISLRKAVKADGEEMQRQNTVFFGDAGSEPVFIEDEESNRPITYMIELQGKAIGKIRAEREQASAFISGFGIMPEYRGKGYGRQALNAALSMLNKEGIYDIALDVAVENKRALKLYKSCGFEEQSTMNYYEVK